MADDPSPEQVAAALRLSVGLLIRRLRQVTAHGELSLPESSALSRLERGGPATATELARSERISPQSIGATLATLQERGLVRRDADPRDGRRAILSVTDAGRATLRDRRDARTAHLALALAADFTPGELAQLQVAAPLLERLAQSI